MPTPVVTVAHIDAELDELREALTHSRDDVWRDIWRQRIDTLLERRYALKETV